MTLVELTGPEAGGSGGGATALIGCCVVDVAAAQVFVGALHERSPMRPGLCTALLRYDPVEVCAAGGALPAATLTVLRAQCRALGGGADSGGGGAGCVLSMLAPGLASGGAAAAKAVLSSILPAAALRSVAQLQRQLGGGADQPQPPQWGHQQPTVGAALQAAALQALALAVRQLQRCGLAEELLPTLQFHPLGVETVPSPGGQPTASAPQQQQQQQQQQAQPQPQPQRQCMLLDDRALCTLHVLQGPLEDRRGSLLAALDGTVSGAGRRRLRHWLCRCGGPSVFSAAVLCCCADVQTIAATSIPSHTTPSPPSHQAPDCHQPD
jgi:hypothetical protein